MIGDMTAAEIRMAEEDEAMEPIIKQYEYRGRLFEIAIERADEGYWSDITELGDMVSQPSGYTYRERHEWEGSGNFYPLGFGAMIEATNAIRQTVDDEMGVPF